LFLERNLPTKEERLAKKRKLPVLEQRYIARVTKKRKLEETVEDDQIFDIWEEKKEEGNQKKEYLKYLERHSKKAAKLKTPKNVDSVVRPKGGSSYNPSEEDHARLLQLAVDEQIRKKKEYDLVMEKVTPGKGRSKMGEILIGVYGDNASDDSYEEKEHENIAFIPRKSQKQKNKEKRMKQEERELKLRKKEKLLRSITTGEAIKSYEVTQKESEQKQILLDEIKLHKESIPKKLGKEKFVEDDIDVLLSEELPGALRKLDPTTDLLHDRFKSLQRRNIIEVRNQKPYHRKYSLKTRMKIRHREYMLSQEEKYLKQD